MGWSKDNVFTKCSAEKARRLRIKVDAPSTFGLEGRATVDDSSCITATRFKKRKIKDVAHDNHDTNSESSEEEDSSYLAKPVTGGSQYVKVKSIKVSKESCILADRRMTSIRQQSDQLLAYGGAAIAASPTTVFRNREKSRMKTLEQADVSGVARVSRAAGQTKILRPLCFTIL